jgi:hypothetical protein
MLYNVSKFFCKIAIKNKQEPKTLVFLLNIFAKNVKKRYNNNRKEQKILFFEFFCFSKE